MLESCTNIPLIINGDDFGYSEAVNRAIIQAHHQGVLSSASLMVNEAAVAQAVTLAKENPTLAVGLHLALVLGRSALPHSEIPHLTNQRNEFSNSPFLAGMNYYFSKTARRELRREMKAQFDRFVTTGLPFSHVDGHNHLHMHPVIFSEMLELCEGYGVKRIRIVKGEIGLSLRLDRRNLPSKLLLGIVFNLLGNWCEKKVLGRGFIHPRKVYGLLQTGAMNEEYLINLIKRMEKNDSEIYAHPLSLEASELESRENPGGQRELLALISEQVRNSVTDAGFQLSNYQSLRGIEKK